MSCMDGEATVAHIEDQLDQRGKEGKEDHSWIMEQDSHGDLSRAQTTHKKTSQRGGAMLHKKYYLKTLYN